MNHSITTVTPEQLAELEKLHKSASAKVLSSPTKFLVMGIGAFLLLNPIGFELAIAGALPFVYGAVKRAVRNGENAAYMQESGLFAHLLKEAELVRMTKLVGKPIVLAQLEEARDDGKPLSGAAIDFLEACGSRSEPISLRKFLNPEQPALPADKNEPPPASQSEPAERPQGLLQRLVGSATRLGAIDVPAQTVPNQPPAIEMPTNGEQLRERLKTECPALLKLVKAPPVRAVGAQRTGKTTLVKRLALVRMVLLSGHQVVAASPHYEPENPYPAVFEFVGNQEGLRDKMAIRKAWAEMSSAIDSCRKTNATFIWDEFGAYEDILSDTSLSSVLKSSLREASKFEVFPIFIAHGETKAFLPGSSGLVKVFLDSTVRVETIGEMIPGPDGLDAMRPTGRFTVRWLDGTQEEGQIPSWLTEELLVSLLPVESRKSLSSATESDLQRREQLENLYLMEFNLQPPQVSENLVNDPSLSPLLQPPEDPAIELISQEPNPEKREALMIAYQWATRRRYEGKDVNREVFLDRARKDRSSTYLVNNRDQIWAALESLLA